ncbi:MAG: hypothetical protein ACRDQ7_04005 [Haloechinothrix sp.]
MFLVPEGRHRPDIPAKAVQGARVGVAPVGRAVLAAADRVGRAVQEDVAPAGQVGQVLSRRDPAATLRSLRRARLRW